MQRSQPWKNGFAQSDRFVPKRPRKSASRTCRISWRCGGLMALWICRWRDRQVRLPEHALVVAAFWRLEIPTLDGTPFLQRSFSPRRVGIEAKVPKSMQPTRALVSPKCNGCVGPRSFELGPILLRWRRPRRAVDLPILGVGSSSERTNDFGLACRVRRREGVSAEGPPSFGARAEDGGCVFRP